MCGLAFLTAVVEYDRTDRMFANPSDARTEAYVTGRVG